MTNVDRKHVRRVRLLIKTLIEDNQEGELAEVGIRYYNLLRLPRERKTRQSGEISIDPSLSLFGSFWLWRDASLGSAIRAKSCDAQTK